MKPTLNMLSRHTMAALYILFVLFALVMMPVRNAYILRWIDELSLFQTGAVYFSQMARYPGGIVQYVGAWLSQFMYYPWLGSSILTAMWLAMALLARFTWRVPQSVAPLTLLPGLFLLAGVTALDEAWMSLGFAGYLFVATLGSFLSVGVALAASRIKPLWAKVLLLTAIPAAYQWLGFWALFGTLLGLLTIARRLPRHPWIVVGAVIPPLVSAAITPELFYLYYNGFTGDNACLYVLGLPSLLFERYDVYLWMPLIGLVVSLLALAVVKNCKGWIAALLILGTGAYVVSTDRKPEQYRATVLMLMHLDHMRWDKIVSIASRLRQEPTFAERVIVNIAQIRLGGEKKGVRYYDTPQDNPRKATAFVTTAYVNVPVNYFIGSTQQSYHWAMEHSVKYGLRVFFVKYMVRSAIAQGEFELAARYNRLLMGTLFHRNWAKHYQRYIDNPELLKESPEFMSLPDNPATDVFS